MGKNDQYMKNMSIVSSQIVETGTTIQTMVDNLRRAKDVTLQGATGSNTTLQRQAIAEEINQILEEAVVMGNRQTNGRYIFGGTRTQTPAFEAVRDADGRIADIVYQGDNESIEVAISDGVKVSVNEAGNRVFQSNEDVFQTLIDIRDNLLNGDQDGLSQNLGQLDRAEEQLLTALSRVASVENRLDRVTQDTMDFNFQFERVLSDAVDADFAETMVNLNSESNAFQAALAASARVLQPSLLDYLR